MKKEKCFNTKCESAKKKIKYVARLEKNIIQIIRRRNEKILKIQGGKKKKIVSKTISLRGARSKPICS